ncbi:MAG: Fic family protein [Thermoplasmatota archaeon]
MDETILKGLRSALLERMDLAAIPEEIWKRSSALNTWGTNAIEGSTITWKDARKILLEERSVKDRPIRDVLETIQHESAFRGLLTRKNHPVTLVTVLELHEEVFKGVLREAGMWRRINVRIHGTDFMSPRMEKVIPLMEDLIKEYNSRDIEGENVFSMGAWFHYTFESIHPFQDGNGRVGRLLLNLHFLKHNWPPIHILPNDRDNYISSFDNGARGVLDPMTDLFRRLMGSSLVDLLDGVGTSDDELIDLKTASELVPYDPKYLGLRCKSGVLPGVLSGHRWKTSRRALDLYMKDIGRK